MTMHSFLMEDDYECQEGEIAVAHDTNAPLTPELIFLLGSAVCEGEMLLIAEERGYLRINSQGCKLDPVLLKRLRAHYQEQLDDATVCREPEIA
jgi:hypothetical protein